ncbi:MAG TPA: hypothetical protein VKW08_19450 [Xanthobacteraceae bacterium]|jgi:hypothetical protein|nr:hypothetical protein [Xanthobacteraceae bacterium]
MTMTDRNATMTQRGGIFETASTTSYGGFADAIGGIATIVLAIVALTGTHSDIIVPIATIVFGAALLVHGGSLLSEYAHIIFPPGTATDSQQEFTGGSLSAVFLVGAAGIVLGVLALLGIQPTVLTAVAVIAFGSALVLSSNAVWHLYLMKRSTILGREPREGWHLGSEMLAGEMASGSAGMQALAGLAAAVLGILAVVGTNPEVLTVIGLLVLGTTIVLTGGALSGAALSFMRPSAQSSVQSSRTATTTIG